MQIEKEIKTGKGKSVTKGDRKEDKKRASKIKRKRYKMNGKKDSEREGGRWERMSWLIDFYSTEIA